LLGLLGAEKLLQSWHVETAGHVKCAATQKSAIVKTLADSRVRTVLGTGPDRQTVRTLADSHDSLTPV
jgi:hypothetical protein